MTASERPFPGLAPFTESDADHARFVGREEETRLIAANLLAARLTVLYGPAGVGKSSVLRAGLVHRLRQNVAGASRVVVVYVDSWTEDPAGTILDVLAAEAQRLGADGDAPPGGLALDDALEAWSTRIGARLLLVLDQFEEYCLYHPPDALPFDLELPRAIERDDVDVRLLLSLREDALASLDRYKGRVASLFGNRYRLENLSAAKARRAIELPIEQYNAALAPGHTPVTLEAGLADEVIAEIAPGGVALASQGRGVGAAAGAGVETAYLQLIMSALWIGAADTRVLRVATLRSLGGATGIVRGHVDAIVGALSVADQSVAARALHFLVTPSGAKIAHNARDLSAYAEVEPARLVTVLDRLCGGEAFLLRRLSEDTPAGGPRFELFHDVLAPAILDWRARFLARRETRRIAPLLSLIIALVVAVAGAAMYAAGPGWLRSAEGRTIDARQALGAPVLGAGDYRVVSFDERSEAQLGAWPVDRRVHGRLIDALRRQGARVIAYDIEFEQSGPSEADRDLQAAITRAGPRLVLAGFTLGDDNQPSLFGEVGTGATAKLLRRMRTRAAFTGIPLEDDGAFRQIEASVRYPADDAAFVPTFAFTAAQLAGGDMEAWRGAIDIDYGGGPGSLRTVSAVDVLDGAERDLAGKIVVVGSPVGDVHPTPASDTDMFGAEIQATAIATVLARDAAPLRDILLIAALALVPCAFIRVRGWIAATALACVAVAYMALALLAWNAGTLLPVAIPLAALGLSSLGLAAVRRRMRRRTSGAHAVSVRAPQPPAAVASELLAPVPHEYPR